MHTDQPYHPNEAEKSLPHHDMIFVKGGEFMMGDDESENDGEKPAHRVRVRDFCMARYPVTQALWELVMGDNPSYFKGLRRPVERVSWGDAQGFIKKLNTITKRKYRLPTEAEWEYAARGGQLSEGYIYAGSDKLKQVGWYSENSGRHTHEVGEKYPNELGLYDTCGNVYEWCNDWSDLSIGHNYYSECHEKGLVEDPKGLDLRWSVAHICRGGSWGYNANRCRVVSRSSSKDGTDLHIGFRLALSLQSVG